MKPPKLQSIIKNFEIAKSKKQGFESLWQECYAYALPTNTRINNIINLFDGTAADSAEQLASSLLAELTPPWSKWFSLSSGVNLFGARRDFLLPLLEKIERTIAINFERSNLTLELHQCFMDLVVAGNACLLFEEANIGEPSAFKFCAIPLSEVFFEEGASGHLDVTYRESSMGFADLVARFAEVGLPEKMIKFLKASPENKVRVIENVSPRISEQGLADKYEYVAFIADEVGAIEPILLKQGVFNSSPFINFRWMKTPGEIYGRSPLMKALPDVKTANKVVELILKNAAIAATGIWQAEDDGVLNPANIKLVPGSIIPKALGSKGLTPLESPGDFDVSQLVLADLRSRIRHAMLVDKLATIESRNMTATEVLERSTEMTRILGATYGRLQSELLNPIIFRAINILKRRGEIEDINVDGREVELHYQSPIAKKQMQNDSAGIVEWLSIVNSLGDDAHSVLNKINVAKYLGRALGVPEELILDKGE